MHYRDSAICHGVELVQPAGFEAGGHKEQVGGCCQAVRRNDIPDRYAFKKLYPADREWINAGDSAIVAPDGRWLAEPLHEAQGLVMAEIDIRQALGSRWIFDASSS